MNTNVVIDQSNFDVDEALEKLAAQRFSMPPHVVAAFKQAGALAVAKLLKMMQREDFDKLPIKDQMLVFNLIFDRAYGKSETASTSELTNHKIGAASTERSQDHRSQLDAIEQRAKALADQRIKSGSSVGRQALTGPSAGDGVPTSEGGSGSGGAARGSMFPELAKQSRARNTSVTGDNLSEQREKVVALRAKPRSA